MKSMTKRLLAALLAVAALFALAGCSKSDSSSSASSEAASSILGSAADYDYQNFTYSDGLDENGYWEGIRALDYVTLPEGGIGLDVGCGSGALTIACAKRNPQGKWKLCRQDC